MSMEGFFKHLKLFCQGNVFVAPMRRKWFLAIESLLVAGRCPFYNLCFGKNGAWWRREFWIGGETWRNPSLFPEWLQWLQHLRSANITQNVSSSFDKENIIIGSLRKTPAPFDTVHLNNLVPNNDLIILDLPIDFPTMTHPSLGTPAGEPDGHHQFATWRLTGATSWGPMGKQSVGNRQQPEQQVRGGFLGRAVKKYFVLRSGSKHVWMVVGWSFRRFFRDLHRENICL